MKTRLVNAVVFLGLYLAFLSWYDGWGMDPLTAEEIDKIVGEAEAQDSNPEELKNLRQLLKDDDGEEFGLAALVMPATLGHIRSISKNGERMPAKSTYFYPKLLSGLAINSLE